MEALAWARSLAGDVTDLVLSRACIGCDALGPPLCARCAGRLDPLPFRCADLVHGLPPVIAALAYHSTARTAVLEHKERGLRWLRRPLGHALAASVDALLAGSGLAGSGLGASEVNDALANRPGTTVRTEPGIHPPVALVPVPSHRGSVRTRGRDTLDELADTAAADLRRIGVPARVVTAIARAGDATPQKERNVGDRLAGPGGTMRVSPASAAGLLRERAQVVVVDDVVTTGATAHEAVRALTAAGLTPVGVAVVAAALSPRR